MKNIIVTIKKRTNNWNPILFNSLDIFFNFISRAIFGRIKINLKASANVIIKKRNRNEMLKTLTREWIIKKGEIAIKIISKMLKQYLKFLIDKNSKKKSCFWFAIISLCTQIPTELINSIENTINKKIVKFVARELEIKKLNPLNAKVIKKTIKKPFLDFSKKSKKRKLKESFKIFLIGIFFIFIGIWRSGRDSNPRYDVTRKVI